MATATLSTSDILQQFERYVVPNYIRSPIVIERGSGSQVWDTDGNRYLDFFNGWGCNLLGHCPPTIIEAVRDQLETLIHVPNTWHTGPQGSWAELLCERSFGTEGRAFFCNSGAEANEAAIKLTRLHAKDGRYKIITFEGGFHGRTLATTAASAQPKFHAGLGPLVAGFVYAPFGDLDAVVHRIDDQTAAIMIEPVQGEGGVRVPPDGFLAGLRQLADQHGLLLIFDEVQTGCGRTGEWFGYQHFQVTPDILTLAKALCGGLAGAAMITTAAIAPSLRPGMHASTFGGNSIAARAGIAMIETIERDGLLNRAKQLSAAFRKHLTPLAQELDIVDQLRICGLMIGLELKIDAKPVVAECVRHGLLINCTQGTVLRLLPAMTLSDDELAEGCEILAEVLRKYQVEQISSSIA